MSGVSTHVLDAVSGEPAVGVPVTLLRADDTILATRRTDADGRLGDLGGGPLDPDVYRLRFDTAAYFTARNIRGFYPEIVVAFEVDDAATGYHVALLLSPFAYSTYRGS